EAKKTASVMEHRRQAAERDKEIEIERAKASGERKILDNILPKEITARLINGENPIADHFESVSVLFMDIVDFTPLATSITAQQLVHLLNAIFSAADGVMREFGLEKIKTIGDAYMAVAGAPVVQADHVARAAQAALKLLDVMENLVVTFPENYGDRSWIQSIPEIQVRIGLHCGSAAAGVVGENKFLYDLWGDAVNTASRMESHGEPGKIHISEEFLKKLLMVNGEWLMEESDDFSSLTINHLPLTIIPRGEMDIKGKGMMKTYFWRDYDQP
ncbi:MAG: adenylate/guanylate cyclase domain-containing protein, partial [Ignavibacteria bacterium]|nr:adenylate/guanylate cyclase domain-containing protein [Ignavibacteria bacterium]